MVYAVVGWLVVQVANATFADFGIPVWAYRFVVLMVVLGFPISLVVAWAFELTPEGIKTSKVAREEHPEAHKDASHAKKRHWYSLILAAATPTVIFGALALFFYFSRSAPEIPDTASLDNSIAILPLENMSPDPENAYFARGVHEDILTNLSYIRSLTVIARTSVMRYENTDMSIGEIGEELGVRYLLEGSVRKAGNRIKVTAQLIDSNSEGHVWANDYDRKLTAENVFEIQEEISLAIVSALKMELSPEESEQLEKLPTENMAALEAYFKGMEDKRLGGGIGYSKAIMHFEKALSLDPTFSLAHTRLGQIYAQQIWSEGLSVAAQVAKAEPHIKRALELDPTSSEAYVALGQLKGRQNDAEGKRAAYEKAFEINPNNVEAYRGYSNFLASEAVGKQEEAASIRKKAYELDPNSYSTQMDLAVSLRWLDQYDEAIKVYRKAYASGPTNSTAPRGISFCFFQLGDVKKARWWAKRALSLASSSNVRINILKIAGDDEARATLSLETLKESPRNGNLIWHLTEACITTGQPEMALEHWKIAYPSLLKPSAKVNFELIYQAKDLARLLISMGEGDQAAHLISEALSAGGNHLKQALLYAVLGDKGQTLAALQRFFDDGGSPERLMLQDELRPYFSTPEYNAMLPGREAKLAAQLKRIQKMDINGELSPIPESLGSR